jgi:hypothetical protein
MSIKTVCEDIFLLSYRQSLKGEEPHRELERRLGELENSLHSMRLFYYLTLIAEALGVSLPEEGDFSKNFSLLMERVLREFHRRYEGELSPLGEEDFVNLFLRDAKLQLGNIEGYIEDLIVILLGFLVDKTLSELFALTKIKNLVRERQGHNIPLL